MTNVKIWPMNAYHIRIKHTLFYQFLILSRITPVQSQWASCFFFFFFFFFIDYLSYIKSSSDSTGIDDMIDDDNNDDSYQNSDPHIPFK